MIGPTRLALRSLQHHRLRTAILILCIALVGALPLAVQLLIARYEAGVTARAASTPLVVGAPGSRFDLLLHSLYFRGEPSRPLSLADSERIAAETVGGNTLATAIPVVVTDTARGFPLVGTTLDLFAFRGLVPVRGTLPQLLGDAVLGAEVARELGLAPGDTILSDSGKLYDIGSTYPLKMHVAGVLGRRGTPDDRAVFVDLRTAWVVQGLGHGHEELGADADPALVLSQEPGTVTANAAVRTYTEITDANRGSFHFHGDATSWPVTAVLVVPRDAKSRTILATRLENDAALEAIEPAEVLDETLSLVFRVKRFFDANTLLVTVATALFLALIVALDWKVRERERETLFKIGAGRGMIVRLAAIELGAVLVAGIGVAAAAVSLAIVFIDARLGV